MGSLQISFILCKNDIKTLNLIVLQLHCFELQFHYNYSIKVSVINLMQENNELH